MEHFEICILKFIHYRSLTSSLVLLRDSRHQGLTEPPPVGRGNWLLITCILFDHTRTGGAPRMRVQFNAGATSQTTRKTIHTIHTPIHANKANTKGWLWRPNDIRGACGPKASWHLSGILVLKNLTQESCPDGDRSQVRCARGAHATACSITVNIMKFLNIRPNIMLQNSTLLFFLKSDLLRQGMLLWHLELQRNLFHTQAPIHNTIFFCKLNWRTLVQFLRFLSLLQQSSMKFLQLGSLLVSRKAILHTFHHFTYVTTHSPTLPSLYLHHSSFSNPSVASPTWQFILQTFFRFSYVTSSSLNSPGDLPMTKTVLIIP